MGVSSRTKRDRRLKYLRENEQRAHEQHMRNMLAIPGNFGLVGTRTGRWGSSPNMVIGIDPAQYVNGYYKITGVIPGSTVQIQTGPHKGSYRVMPCLQDRSVIPGPACSSCEHSLLCLRGEGPYFCRHCRKILDECCEDLVGEPVPSACLRFMLGQSVIHCEACAQRKVSKYSGSNCSTIKCFSAESPHHVTELQVFHTPKHKAAVKPLKAFLLSKKARGTVHDRSHQRFVRGINERRQSHGALHL